MTTPDDSVSADLVEEWWTAYQRLVRDVAYRILGSVADAEDVSQEAYLRLMMNDPAEINDPRAWLVTVASRLSIDRLRSHEHARRAYVGPWLPEPVVADASLPPEDRVTLDDSVRMALLIVLERLTPGERTAFLLHDVFGMDFASIAEVVGASVESSRQLASRGRRRIADSAAARRFSPDPVAARELCERFSRACTEGDLDALVSTLADDVHGDFDSGGLFPGAPLRELRGARVVAQRLLDSLAGQGLNFNLATVNGDLGLVVRRRARVISVLSLEITDAQIVTIHGVGNPAKLRHLNPTR